MQLNEEDARKRNIEIMKYRKLGEKWSNRLFFFSDETVFNALHRKTVDFKESGITLIYSLRQPTGSGKSNAALYSALQLSELNNYKFNLDTDLVFTGKDFLARLDELNSKRQGEIIIWDEGGIGGGFSRAWKEQVNWDIQEAVRMSRFFLPHIFIVLPLLNLIDIDVRRLTNIEFESYLTDQYQRKCYGEFRTRIRGENNYGQIFDIKQAPVRIHNDIESEDLKKKFEMIVQFTLDFVDESLYKQYEERKENAFEEIKKERSGEGKRNKKEERNIAIKVLHENGMSEEEIAKIVGLTQQAVSYILQSQ